MRRFQFSTSLAFLIVIALTGITAAESPANTVTTEVTTVTTAATTATPEQAGGSVYFETFPEGAAIWIDGVRIGTSPFTHFTVQTGLREVRVWKKGYENYTGTVTITEGKMERFYARLQEAPRTMITETPEYTLPVVPVITAARTTVKKTMTIPTPWPSTPESAGDPALAFGVAALGTLFFALRRR